ncbi:type II toxin-antitoxin system Rv0910 family toxin [Nocardioides antri]|uniref:SRPBCC family protein n=1 Tax=Nocardioides antri TaxID=2607659 RepID=A0A5B1M4J1_9ACTN|nr:SRPBCC family protein [Nocardioides antri]KAA1427681.1 SRPBCC family protein [Nocardioides antri]
MATVSVSKHINVPVEKGWEKLLDLPTWEEWLTLHVSWKGDLPTRIEEGTRLTEVVSVMGMANKIEWTVEELEEQSRVKISGTGMAAVKVSIDFSIKPDGDGSEVEIEAGFSGAMIVGPIGTAVGKAAQKDLDESIDKFAALVG